MTTAAPVTTHDVARGLGTTLLARLGGLVEVVAQPAYVWLFGLSAFGLYAVLWAAINLIENFADLGMTSALQRSIPQAKNEADAVAALRTALLVGVLPCLAIAALISAFAPDVAPLMNVAAKDQPLLVGAIRLFAWALPLWAFVEIATSALRARRLFGAEIRIRLFWEQLIRLTLAGLCYLLLPDIRALLIAHLLSLAIICGLGVRLLSKSYDLRLIFMGPLGGAAAHETIRAGLTVLPANIVARLFGDAPPLILNAWFPGAGGATAAALYVIARKISSVVQLVRTAFAYVLAPLASAAAHGGKAQVQPIYAFATRLSVAMVLPLGLLMAAGGATLLKLFGHEAQGAWAALTILILARMAEAVFGAALPVQQVIGGYRQQLLGSVLGLIVAVAVGFVLLPVLGLTGLAIAVTMGFLVTALLPIGQLWAHDNIHPFEPPFAHVARRTVGIAALFLLMAWASYALPHIVQLMLLPVLILTAIWTVFRFALPMPDRTAMGSLARKLHLI